jgi:sulfatase modifying factor 1
MWLSSFRNCCVACLVLGIPLAVLGLLVLGKDNPRSDNPRSKEVFTNSLQMKLVPIPAGKFMMGLPESDKAPLKQHQVEIKEPFLLGMHEVRVQDFRAFVEDDGYQTEAEKAGDQNTWKNPAIAQAEDHPVILVSWNDAQAFCTWLSKKEAKKYRLPTEAEWEYACRAGTTTRFYSGDDFEGLREVANVGYYTTMPVGQFKANAFGLFDMHGNVYEWCQDVFEQGNPYRVIRGGSWDWCDNRESCGSGSRTCRQPSQRHHYVGFRVARDEGDTARTK